MSTLLYNPDKKNKQLFIEEFVVRTSIFDDLFKDIQTGKMKYPEQHYLLLGQRGSGKTTLLNRLKYAIEDDSKLNKWLVPILFNEEQYHIIELVNVWENIANYLEDFYDFNGIREEMSKHISKKDFEQISLDILIKHLDKHGKKIVLFIDNIGDLFKKFDELEVYRLREILQTIPQIRLIAGSPVVLESITDYHQPLFEFFKVIQLKGLTREETITMLKKLAKINHQDKKIENIISKTPSRIETLRTLSGGVPRTIALLFMVFLDDEHGNAVTDLEKILDMVTPLYKHRMDDLPTQQQKIVDAVAKNWDAVSVKELAEQLRMESKVISAQLRQLEKNQVIEKRTTNTKNHIYLIRERFFNIWYLMRYGRKQDRQRVIWLVKFLELWCDGDEIEKRILNYTKKSKKGLMDKHTQELYAEVYSFFDKVKPETKFLLKESAPEYVAKQIKVTDEECIKLIDKYVDAKNWNKLIQLFLQKGDNLSDVIKNKIVEIIENDYKYDFLHLVLKNIEYCEKVDGVTDLPNFYGKYLYYFHTSLSHYLDEETLNKNYHGVTLLFNKLEKENCIQDFEINQLALYILTLIANKHYNLAMSFFKEKEELKERLKFQYILTQYYCENKNVEILNKYGTELKDVVSKFDEIIDRLQSKNN